jgi:hypothetical protein
MMRAATASSEDIPRAVIPLGYGASMWEVGSKWCVVHGAAVSSVVHPTSPLLYPNRASTAWGSGYTVMHDAGV